MLKRIKLLFALTMILASSSLFAKGKSGGSAHTVRGSVTKTGQVRKPHVAKNPNSTQHDNYSTKGNVNPITGKPGTKTATK